MQGLMDVGLIGCESTRIDVKSVKVAGARNIGQGHRVKVCARLRCRGDTSCKV